jgi:glycosyltransferase involved in cell wall biosynthesis
MVTTGSDMTEAPTIRAVDRPAPAISVVLPTYNGAAYLRESVESVMTQDSDDFELIVCDDRSTDTTWSMLQQYGGDARCRLLRNETNLGLFPTLNRLVRETRGEWVHLWSQDDRMLPQCLRRTREFANAHPQVGMIYSGRYQIDGTGRRLPEWPEDSTPELISPLLAARIMFYFGSIAGTRSTRLAGSPATSRSRETTTTGRGSASGCRSGFSGSR